MTSISQAVLPRGLVRGGEGGRKEDRRRLQIPRMVGNSNVRLRDSCCGSRRRFSLCLVSCIVLSSVRRVVQPERARAFALLGHLAPKIEFPAVVCSTKRRGVWFRHLVPVVLSRTTSILQGTYPFCLQFNSPYPPIARPSQQLWLHLWQ